MKYFYFILIAAFLLLFNSLGHSQSPTDLNRVKVGERAPGFTLENMDQQKISLDDFFGKKNVVLVFYRGHW